MALALVNGGCAARAESAGSGKSELAIGAVAASDARQTMAVPASLPTPRVPIPSEFIGTWKLVEIVCDKDSEEEPPKHLPQAILHLGEHGGWEFSIEGFTMQGEVEVHPLKAGPELRLRPGALDFHMERDVLVNDSEGDAPHLCVRHFKRDRS